jgi:GNAT superfamily N-acetyltransferase
MKLVSAHSPRDLEAVKALFREYDAFLNVDLQFQGFDKELERLPGKYAPPFGVLLLAKTTAGECIGCGAIRKFGKTEDRTCEMKRLYVRPSARNRGVGHQIAQQLIKDSIRMGYHTMVLDTLERLVSARRLYQSLGFVPVNPYYHNPLPDVLYWQLDLKGRPRRG